MVMEYTQVLSRPQFERGGTTAERMEWLRVVVGDASLLSRSSAAQTRRRHWRSQWWPLHWIGSLGAGWLPRDWRSTPTVP